jgi:tetratricopeptide (TPR) repeat protein
LRGDLDNIVLTALRKDPTRRYASVGQFSEDIQRHLEGLPVMARGDSLGYRATKFIRRNRVAVASFGLALLLLGPLALLAYLRSSRQAITVGPPRTIAVLPFKTVGTQSSDDYLATGIPDAIVSALTNVKGVTVRPIRSSLKYTGAGQDPVEAGRALRVDVVIDGTTSSDEERLRITARLTRVEDSPGDWKTKTLDDLDDLLDIQDVIPAQLAEAIGLELTDQERMLVAKRHTNNVQAYRLYLKGRHLFNRRNAKDAKQAIECFEQAIELDPSFALAYSALAHIHILAITPAPTLEKMQRARIAAMKSLEIDDTLAEAHMALGRALIYCDWDWAGSERAFKRAIELSPNYADAHFWYSHNLTVQARHDEALAELKRALEIDPFSPGYVMRLGTALHLAGQHDRAIDEYRKTPFQVDSAYYQVHWRLGTVYAEKGMYADAISSLKKAEVLSGERPLAKASLAYVHVKSGNSAEARKVLAELGSLPEGEGPRFTLAAVYGCLGEKDRAFRLLEELYHERESGIIGIRVSRMFECIRSDPRFEDLCRRIGLTQ